MIALRLYTMAAFKVLNKPLRLLLDEHPVPHPLPVTVAILAEAIKQLAGVERKQPSASSQVNLWRGLHGLEEYEQRFVKRGGMELGFMSVSTSLPVALQYAANPGGTSLLLKLDTKSMPSTTPCSL